MSTKQPTITRTSPASSQTGTAYQSQLGLGTYALGSSDDALHKVAFDTNPINSLDDDTIKNSFAVELRGNKTFNVEFSALLTADGASTTPINMDYKNAPLINYSITDFNGNTVGGGKGMPAGPRVPTMASPKNLSTDPADLPVTSTKPVYLSHGGENGSVTSPSETSKDGAVIHSDGTSTPTSGIGTTAESLGNLTLGKSTYTISTGG